MKKTALAFRNWTEIRDVTITLIAQTARMKLDVMAVKNIYTRVTLVCGVNATARNRNAIFSPIVQMKKTKMAVTC